VEDNQAMIAYQNNPDKVYTYICTDSFVEELDSILKQDTIEGMGSFVSASRKTGDLQDMV
jgi:hypothetical protein